MRNGVFAFALYCSFFGAALAARNALPPGVVATVDGEIITEADLQARLLVSESQGGDTAQSRDSEVDDLIDRQLVRNFLKKNGVAVPDDLVELRWQSIENAAADRKLNLNEELKRIGYTPEALKDDLRLPIAWKLYVTKHVAEPQVKAYFQKHKAMFDGTQRHVRQIVLKAPLKENGETWGAKEHELVRLREEIASGRKPFADVAKEISDSPSKTKGGDLGFIHRRGDLPEPVAQAAFTLNLNEISQPIRSPFGVHLIVAEEEKPGDLSLEDARPDVMEAIGKEMWTQQTAELRKKAKIVKAPVEE
jgi:parvulin-like peptidyl-prolyl isomerase